MDDKGLNGNMTGTKGYAFISYSSKHKGAADSLRLLFKRNDIPCWMAPYDIPGGSKYAYVINDALENCSCLVLLLTDAAQRSVWVDKETERAITYKKPLIPLQLEDMILNSGFKLYIGNHHIVALPEIKENTPEMKKVLEDVRRFICVGGDEKESAPEKSRENNIENKEPCLPKIRKYAKENFVGREKELSDIHGILTSDKNKVFLVGMGGVGKSELAKMYCQKYAEYYNAMVFVDYSGSLRESIVNDNTFPIIGVSRNDHLNESDQDYFLYKLNILRRIAGKDTLIVIDNFDVQDDENLDIFCSGEYSVIFTTRNQSIRDNLNELTVGKMSEEEQYYLFTAIYGRRLSEQGTEAVKSILAHLDSNTLSIRLVASTMKERRITPEEMLEILKSRRSTEVVYDLIYDTLNEMLRLSDLSDEEMYLMKNLALIPLSGIEVKRLYSWCGLTDYSIVDGLIGKNWVIHDHAKDEVHLHPLIAELLLERLSEDLDCCNKFLESLAWQCEHVTGTDDKYKHWLVSLTRHICEVLPAEHKLRETMLVVRARAVSHISLYVDVIEQCKTIMPELKQTINYLTACELLSHMYCLSGEPQKGIDVAEQGLKKYSFTSFDELSEEDIHIYKELVMRLCEGNRILGDYDLALKYAYKDLDICERYYSDRGNSLIWAKYHVARTLFSRNGEGDLVESERIFKEVKEMCIRVNDISSVIFVRELIGQIHMKNGQYDMAIDETSAAYDELIKQFGKYHADIATNLILRGNIYRTMGNEETAIHCYNEAIEILDKCGVGNLEKIAKDIRDSGEIGYLLK